MLKCLFKNLLLIVFLQIFFMNIFADSTIDELVELANKIDSISIEHITEIDIPDTLDSHVTVYGKLKQMITQLDINKPTFILKDHKVQVVFGMFLTLFIIFFIIAYRNASERNSLVKNRKKEYAKLDKRIEDRTKKLIVTNRDLEYEIEQLKISGVDLQNLKNAIDKMKLGVIMTDRKSVV